MLLMMNWDSTVWIADGNCGAVRRAIWQIGNAQNLRRIKQRKGNLVKQTILKTLLDFFIPHFF